MTPFALPTPAPGAMSGARKYVSIGLVLLVCTLTGHCGAAAPSVATQSSSSRDSQSDWLRMVETARHAENARGRHGSRTDAPATSRARGFTAEPRNQRTDKAEKSFGELSASLSDRCCNLWNDLQDSPF